MKTTNPKKGFTLIELLVVISIIGVLSGIVMQNLSKSRSMARNANRLASIEQIAKGFQIATTGANGNVFPSSGVAWRCLGKTSCWVNPFSSSATVDAVLKSGMSSLPAVDQKFLSGEHGDVVVYHSNWGGGTGGSGIVFPAGAYLAWIMEDQAGTSADSCGRGGWWANTDAWTNVPSYECLLYLGPGNP